MEDDTATICNICLDEIKIGKKLNCGHIFHLRCIKEWITGNSGCPLCKTPIDSEMRKSTSRTQQFEFNENNMLGGDEQHEVFNSAFTKQDPKFVIKKNPELNKYNAYKQVIKIKNLYEKSNICINIRR